MTLLFFVLAGVLIALFRGKKSGDFSFSGLTEIHAVWLPILGFLLHALFGFAPEFARSIAPALTLAYELCILIFCWCNRAEKVPVLLMTAGTLCNFAVIAANSFRMPVSPAALSMYPGMTALEVAAKKTNYFIADAGTRLYALADIIPLPLGKLGGFISAGDLLLGVGLMLFTARFLERTARKERDE